jgi:hypothetical protein
VRQPGRNGPALTRSPLRAFEGSRN